MIFLFIFLAIIILPLILVITTYNSLQRKKVAVDEGWSSLGTVLQQRNDLIPNLVETVKGYAKHESTTLTEVTKWRNQSASSHSPEEQNVAQYGFQRAMANVFAIAENYPQLKADAQFMQLQLQLTDIEEKLNSTRRIYNSNVKDYNTQLVVFPANMIAGHFNLKAAVFFEEEEQAKANPKVSFN